MKNLFDVNRDEIKRILTLHEERSKAQYLNIINEQGTSEYKLGSDYTLKNEDIGVDAYGSVNAANDLKLFKGTTFIKTGNDLIATTKYKYVDIITGKGRSSATDDSMTGEAEARSGKIIFSCSQGKFHPSNNPKYKFYDKTKVLSVKLTQICGGRAGKFTEKQGGTKTVKTTKNLIFAMGQNTLTVSANSSINYDGGTAKTEVVESNNYRIQFTCPNKFTAVPTFQNGTSNACLPKDTYTLNFFQNNFCGTKPKEVKQVDVQPKSDFNALYTIANKHNLGNVQVNVNDIVIKSFKYPDYAAIMRGNTPIAYYNCKTNTWGDVQITDTKGLLTGTIKQKVCPQIVTTDTSTPAPDTSTPAPAPNTSTPVNRQKQFAQNTVAGINNIQTSLGIAPNGQLTTKDIDTLLTKLQ